MDKKQRLSLARMLVATGVVSSVAFGAAAAGTESGLMRERSTLVWRPTGDVESVVLRVWDPRPDLDREFIWTPDDPASLLDGDDEIGVTGSGRLVWREKGAADYERGAVHTIYRGSLVDGRPHGYGEKAGPWGSTYKGQWVAGMPQGAGEVLLKNGDQYVGAFREGAFHGAGVYSNANGRIYAGRFEHGVFLERPGRPRQGPEASGPPTPQRSWTAGMQPVRSGDSGIDFKLATERAGYRSEFNELLDGHCLLAYDHSLEQGQVVIKPVQLGKVRSGISSLFDIWKGGERVDATAVCDYYGERPVFLLGDVTNNTQSNLNIDSGYLEVSNSVTDRKPFPVVSTSLTGTDTECRGLGVNIDDKIVVDNYGWGGVRSAKARFRFTGRSAGSGSRSVDLDLKDFNDYQTASILPLLSEMGVRTGELTTERAGCPSRSQVPDCISDVARTGIFGELAGHLYADGTLAATDIVGTLSFQWVDFKGQARAASSPFRVTIPVYGFRIGDDAECGAAAPAEYSERSVMLPVNRSDYRVTFDLPSSLRVLEPRQNGRFVLRVDSEKSALHAFRMVLQLSDGREVRSPPALMNVFHFRSNKTFTENRHHSIYVPGE